MKRFLLAIVLVVLFTGSVIAAGPPLPQTEIDQSKMAITGLTVGKKVIATGYANLQAAVDAAGAGGHVYIPVGTYTSGFTLTSTHNGITIEGAGYGSYIHVATGHAITINGTEANPVIKIRISNLRLNSDTVPDAAYGLNSACLTGQYLNSSQIDHITVSESGAVGMYLYKSLYNLITENSFIDNTFPRNNGSDTSCADIYLSMSGYNIISKNRFTQAGAKYYGYIGGGSIYSMGLIIGGDNNAGRFNIISDNHFLYVYRGIHVVSAPGCHVLDNLFGGFYNALYLDSGLQTVVGNIFMGGNKSISLVGGLQVLTGNAFSGVTESDIETGWNGGNFFGPNIWSGGVYDLSRDNAAHLWGKLSQVRGRANIYDGTSEFIGTVAAYNKISPYSADWNAAFGNIQVGDVIRVIGLGSSKSRGFWKVVKVDNPHVYVDGDLREAVGEYFYLTVYRYLSYTDDDGGIGLADRGVIRGGGRISKEHIISVAVTTGSVATIDSSPVAGGTGYAVGDRVFITNSASLENYVFTESADAVAVVTSEADGVVTGVALVDSGRWGYASGTYSTIRQSGTGSGLTISVTAVGLTEAQVSGTILTNTGQGDANVLNYLPTAKQGYKFTALMGAAKTNYSWSLANNSGTKNSASGDLINLGGTDGTAGSSHGLQDGSGATNITKGDRIDCFTASMDATNLYYQWFCTKAVAGQWAAY